MKSFLTLPYRTILLLVTVASLLIMGLSLWLGHPNALRTILVVMIMVLNVCVWTLPLFRKLRQRNTDLRLVGRLDGEPRIQDSVDENELIWLDPEQEPRWRPVSERVALLQELAETQKKENNLAEAELSLSQALTIIRDSSGKEGSQFAECLEMMADVYQEQKEYARALETLEDSLTAEENLLRPNKRRLAKRRQKLALAYHQEGDFIEASTHFLHSLDLHEQTFGAFHAETGKLLTDFGAAQQRQGKHLEALQNLKRAHRILDVTLGKDAPEIAKCLFHLALTYERAGKLEQAIAYFERSLSLNERIIGGNGAVAAAYSNLARLHLKLGHLARAQEAATSAIAMLEPGPEMAATLKILGAIYERAGLSSEASSAYQTAHDVWKSGLGRLEASA